MTKLEQLKKRVEIVCKEHQDAKLALKTALLNVINQYEARKKSRYMDGLSAYKQQVLVELKQLVQNDTIKTAYDIGFNFEKRLHKENLSVWGFSSFDLYPI